MRVFDNAVFCVDGVPLEQEPVDLSVFEPATNLTRITLKEVSEPADENGFEYGGKFYQYTSSLQEVEGTDNPIVAILKKQLEKRNEK